MVSILIDDDLQLRNYLPEDAGELFRVVNESRAHLRSWLGWIDGTTKPEHSLQFIQQSLHQLNAQEAIALGIFHHREIVGGIGMHHWDHHLRKAQIGYWMTKEYEGKGIATKCTARFIDFLFEKLNLNKIEIQFIVANHRSAAVTNRLGAKVEGILRESYLINGKLEDIVITGILKREWTMKQDL